MARRIRLLAACGLAVLAVRAPLAEPSFEPGPETPVARVEGQVITLADFNLVLARTARQTFYHGTPDPEKLAELRPKVVEEMILERLLAAEAGRLGIAADEAAVEAKIQAYEERYRGSEEWRRQRDRVLPLLRARMRDNSRSSGLEQAVRRVAEPDEADIRAYHEANPSLFTEPAREHLAVILLSVDPSSNKAAWDKAKAEALRLREKVIAGTPFAELARLHSGDESAGTGGDLGYVHRGMMSTDAQEALDEMQPGDISEPVLLLQGYALFQMLARAPEQLRTFEEVRERAAELYRRNMADKQWQAFIGTLRADADVWLDANLIGIPNRPDQ